MPLARKPRRTATSDVYLPHEIRWNRRCGDILTERPDRARQVDDRRSQEVEPI
jgi:hypothetical protein